MIIRHFIGSLVALLALLAKGAEPVTISPAHDGFSIESSSYTASVDGRGSLSSLVVSGNEFIQERVVFKVGDEEREAGGLFVCPFNQWYAPFAMAGTPVVEGNTITVANAEWRLVYRFLDEVIEFEFSGSPGGDRSFTGGYPPAEPVISLRGDLARACNPAEEGDIGWPVTRSHEPGDYAILAADGASVVFDEAFRVTSVVNHGYLKEPRSLHIVSLCTYEVKESANVRRLLIRPTPRLEHSLLMEIESPVAGHLISGVEEMDFPVTVTALYGQELQGEVRFDGEGYVFKENTISVSVPLRLSAAEPRQRVDVRIAPPVPGHYTGLMQIVVEGTPIYSKRMGLVFQPERIATPPVPEDFDAFWEETLAELEKVPLDLTLEEQPEHETAAGKAYLARFRACEGRWAYAWLYVPKAEGKVAGRVQCPAVSNWQPGLCQKANGELWIAAAVHGGDIRERPAKSDFDYMNTGIESRESYMLRYSYSCLVRCYDILRSRPESNGEISVNGGSQGAGLSLVLAGLRPEIRQVKGVAIALCRIDWTILGLAQWGPRCPPGADPEEIAQIVRYYDPACFAHRIRASEVVLGVGLFDFCAPAEGIFSAVNAIPAATTVRVYTDPYGGHFTYDHKLLQDAAQGVIVPKWQGTAEENKLND